MSKLIATPLLLTLIAGVAQAPGQPLAQAENTVVQPATRVAAANYPGFGVDIGAESIDADADAYHFAWNQWDSSSEEFDKGAPDPHGQVRTWDVFPRDSLLADTAPYPDHEDLSQDALLGFDHAMLSQFPNLAGRSRHASGGSPGSSSKPGAGSSPPASSGDSSPPNPSNPQDAAPVDQSTQPDSPSDPVTPNQPPTGVDQTPPGQTPPVSVPEPTSLALFGLGLLGLRFARRPAVR